MIGLRPVDFSLQEILEEIQDKTAQPKRRVMAAVCSREKQPSSLFPECVARVPVSFGGLGVRLCSRKVVSVSATVRNRPQPSATVRNRLR